RFPAAICLFRVGGRKVRRLPSHPQALAASASPLVMFVPRFLSLGLVALLVLLAGPDAAAPGSEGSGGAAAVAQPDPDADRIPGQYIVVLSERPADAARRADLAAVLAEAVARAGTEVLHRYEAALTGFAARLADEAAEALRNDPR